MRMDNEAPAEVDRAWYLEHRKVLTDTSADQISRFERALLTASGGGVSAMFYVLAQTSAPPDRGWLVASTLFFALSFFCVLFSHLTSHTDMEFEIEKLDNAYRQSEPRRYDKIGVASGWGRATVMLNWTSPVFLLLGGLSFAMFLIGWTS